MHPRLERSVAEFATSLATLAQSTRLSEIPHVLEIEAERLCQILLSQGNVSPLLNLGSSTGHFRSVARPHIARNLFEPLRRAGVAIVHCDLKHGDGVDLVCNVLDPGVVDRLRARRFRCILVANVLEHVRDRHGFAEACEEIVGSGGSILSAVPRSYPYHADPIDALYRPTASELAGLFRRSRVLLAEEIVGPTYAEDLDRRNIAMSREVMLTAVSLLMAWLRPRSFAARAHRWWWLRRPYRISVALVVVR